MIRASITGLLWKAEDAVARARKDTGHSIGEDGVIDALNALIEAVKALLREAQ